jgi:hypothetical protein
MGTDLELRQHLVRLLTGSEAHVNFEAAVGGLPVELRGMSPEGAEHSSWELVEHLRIAQWDILDFSSNPEYRERRWPEDYWPKSAAPASEAAWDESVSSFLADRRALCDLVMDPVTDLYARIPHGSGQTILREALLAGDHNAYHVGQLVLVRRLLGAWHSSGRG